MCAPDRLDLRILIHIDSDELRGLVEERQTFVDQLCVGFGQLHTIQHAHFSKQSKRVHELSGLGGTERCGTQRQQFGLHASVREQTGEGGERRDALNRNSGQGL